MGRSCLDRRICLAWSLQRACIVARLAQIAHQQQRSGNGDEPLPLLRAYKPRSAATEAIPDLQSLWRSNSVEELEQALDDAQSVILEALPSEDPGTRFSAAKLMLRTRQAMKRGWG